MKIYAYLNFNGNCKEAVEFYGKVFNVEPKIMYFKDMPSDPTFPMNDALKDLVLHAHLEIDGNSLKFSDAMPNYPVTMGDNFNITISGTDTEKLVLWFNQLAEGGEVIMPLEKSFFSELYGYVRDKYGIGWQVLYEA